MNVKLLSYSQPTGEFRDMGISDAQELIAYCARVSNPSNQLNTETSEKLIRYLVKHQHWSPLEMVSACIEITTTRDIARQNSIQTDDERLQRDWERQQQQVIDYARSAYQWAIARGIAKEQARAVLPEGLTESRLYMNGTLRSWIHFIELRSANGTQLEHQEVAIACARVIAEIFPLTKDFINQ